MALTYSSYVGALQQLTVSNSLDQNFYAILPSAIDFAEQRIYRELDLLSTVTVDTSVTLAAGVRDAAIPQTCTTITHHHFVSMACVSHHVRRRAYKTPWR